MATGVSLAELLFAQHIQSHLGLLPDLATTVKSKQASQKLDHDKHTDICTFQIEYQGFARNFTNGPYSVVW